MTVLDLLKAGVQIEEKDCEGYRALHYAALYGYKNIVNMLLDSHADIDAKNRQKKRH